MTIKTNYKFNFDKAEDNNFSWNESYSGGGELLHKASGRSIYQMHWLDKSGKMSEEVTGEVRQQARKFWDELNALKKESEDNQRKADCERFEKEYVPEPKHGENGYCRKCHSYCFGDCEAN